MTLTDAVHFCVQFNVDALDPTGYYFHGDPKVPSHEVIYNLRRTAFVSGVAISGTGVRKDVAVADFASRRSDIQMVKDWIVVASKLGDPVIRVFSGMVFPAGHTFDEALAWMVTDFRNAPPLASSMGSCSHFSSTTIFSRPRTKPFASLRRLARTGLAVLSMSAACVRVTRTPKSRSLFLTWSPGRLKKTSAAMKKKEPIDLAKIKAIIERSGYRGSVPFEALGPRDSRAKVAGFLGKTPEGLRSLARPF
jgi:hypothetical protein